MMKLRYGILSTSSITPRFIAAVRDTDSSEVLALTSRSLDPAKEKARLWNVPRAYGSYEELLADPDIDVVYVSMVNSLHYQYAKLALESGHHVLCEKSCMLSAEDSRNLFAIAREKGKFFMEAEKVVFLPVMQEIKQMITEDVLGKVTMADFSSSFDPGYNSWFFSEELGGGPLYSNGVYCLQLLQYLFDSRVTKAQGLCTHSGSGVEDQFAMSFLLENGLLAVNKTSTRSETSHSGWLYGEKARVEIPSYWKAREATIHFGDGSVKTLSHPCEHELVYEVEHVADCIKKGLIESPIMAEKRTVSAISVLTSIKNSF
ncbi:MAG: Gfo/Idh/MocA family oxidoreductase [Lachnospiraceae bacterium]|nr:Gfo/Idh/MocA family oxidoreductase [Lachnospiraceae bacterium]